MACEHEYEELLDESGNSTHIWICKNCGRAKRSGLYDLEPEQAKAERATPARRWVPDPVTCTDILRAVSRGVKSERSIYTNVRREVADFEALSAYIEYLSSLGYLSKPQSGRRYAITGSGREVLATVSEGVERAAAAFPRGRGRSRTRK
jgi:predicted transcriptional regulator